MSIWVRTKTKLFEADYFYFAYGSQTEALMAKAMNARNREDIMVAAATCSVEAMQAIEHAIINEHAYIDMGEFLK